MPVGTHTGAVVASYAGSANFLAAANATGNLVVSQAANTLADRGTATFGGTASLTATLTSSVTSQPISGATLNFSLTATAVTATTNASGARP